MAALAHRAGGLLALAVKHAHPRDARISFTEASHEYHLDGNVKMGLSVTGLLHEVWPDSFDPDQALALMKAGRKWPNPAYCDETGTPWPDDRIKAHWTEVGKLASELGTDMHGKLELHFNGVEVVLLPDSPNHATFHMALTWWKDMEAAGYVPYRTEMLLYDEAASLAGSVDFIAKNTKTNKYAVIDWKRCQTDKPGFAYAFGRKMLAPLEHVDAHTKNKWRLQIGVYAYLLEELYGMPVEKTCMVVCHPDATEAKVFDFSPGDPHGDIAKLVQARRDKLQLQLVLPAAAGRPESPPAVIAGVLRLDMTRLCEEGYLEGKAAAADVDLLLVREAARRARGQPRDRPCLLMRVRRGLEIHGYPTL